MKEKRDIKDNGFSPFTQAPKIISIHSSHFVRWYQRQNSFQDILDETEYMLFTSSDDADRIKSRLAGGLFQDIASISLIKNVAKNNSERTVVLAANALSFFTQLYPNASVIHYSITSDSLEGATAPDGLIVDKSGTVISVCEYTLNENQSYFKNKYLSFRAKKRNFPEIFACSNLLFVVPKTVPLVMEQIKEAIGDRTVKFLELPFSRTEFRKFIETVCTTHGYSR